MRLTSTRKCTNMNVPPMKAAAKAQAESAKATADFMKAVDAPLLALTPIPALILDETTVDFAMEVNEKMPPED